MNKEEFKARVGELIAEDPDFFIDTFNAVVDRIYEDESVEPAVSSNDPREKYDIGCLLRRELTEATGLSVRWSDEEFDQQVELQKAAGVNHIWLDGFVSDNWSKDSPTAGSTYWKDQPRQDVNIVSTIGFAKAIERIKKYRDVGITVGLMHGNDGRDYINNESVVLDADLIGYWIQVIVNVCNVDYNGTPLVRDVCIKREFNDMADRRVDSGINVLREVRRHMRSDQNLCTHNERWLESDLIRVFPYIDAMCVQLGGNDLPELRDNGTKAADFCLMHNIPFWFTEYTLPISGWPLGSFDCLNEPENGDVLLDVGKQYGDLFLGLGMYCTLPGQGGGTEIIWDDVDFINGSQSKVTGFDRDAELHIIDFKWGNFFGGPQDNWYGSYNTSGTDQWTPYKPYGNPEDRNVYGNLWILVPQGEHDVSGVKGRWWAVAFEGYTTETDGLHCFANLNYEHTNVLSGTPVQYPWQPKEDVEYGFFISTDVIYGSGNGSSRTNIHYQKWPSK